MVVTFDNEVICYPVPSRQEEYPEPRVLCSSEILHTSMSLIKKSSDFVFKTIGNSYMQESDRELVVREYIQPNVQKIVESFDYIVTDAMSLPVSPHHGHVYVLFEFINTLLEEFNNRRKLYIMGTEPELNDFNYKVLHVITQRSSLLRNLSMDQAVSFIDNKIGLSFFNK